MLCHGQIEVANSLRNIIVMEMIFFSGFLFNVLNQLHVGHKAPSIDKHATKYCKRSFSPKALVLNRSRMEKFHKGSF